MSEAKPRIADYPFTTLHPNLGVVRVGQLQSFVMADVPGLIEGAAEGAGLGIRFLKHLQRTRLLLHLVDIAPIDPNSDPAAEVQAIARELEKFSPELADKPRWLVINKVDLLSPDELAARIRAVLRRAGGTTIPTPAPSRARAATNCHTSVAAANHSRPAAPATMPIRSRRVA